MVELLVVMAIVALLIAMLLPALQTAKEQVSRVKCMSNLRQRGIAYTAYAQDFRDYLPHVVSDDVKSPMTRYSTEMSLQVASYTNNTLETWWCPDLWAVRTTINNLEDWENKTFEFKAEMSVGAAGFLKTVPVWADPSVGGKNAWGFWIQHHSKAEDGNTRTPVFLATALYLPSAPNPFSGGGVPTRAPRLSDSPGRSLTVAEEYPGPTKIGQINRGGQYRHQYGTGREGGNVLRVEGSAQWYSAGSSDADWHPVMNGSGAEAVIQPFR